MKKAKLRFDPFDLIEIDEEKFPVPSIKTRRDYLRWAPTLRHRLFAARIISVLHNLDPSLPRSTVFYHYRFHYCPSCSKIVVKFCDGKFLSRCECGGQLEAVVVPIIKEQCPTCGQTCVIDPLTFIGRCACGLRDYLATTLKGLQSLLRSDKASSTISELVEILYRFNVPQFRQQVEPQDESEESPSSVIGQPCGGMDGEV